MSDTKIQLNSLEALERLIGGDTELEIEIRNSVVQKFAEKHLKPVAAEISLESVENRITEMAREKLEKDVATFKHRWGGTLTDLKLHPDIVKEIEKQVSILVSDTVRESVNAAIERWYSPEELKKRINSEIDYINKQTIRKAVKEKFQQLLDSAE